MSPQTKKLLEKFALRANWVTPGLADDIDRFDDFIVSAFKKGDLAISFEEFSDTIKPYTKEEEDMGGMTYFNKKRSETSTKFFMFNKYEEGIKLLRKFIDKDK